MCTIKNNLLDIAHLWAASANAAFNNAHMLVMMLNIKSCNGRIESKPCGQIKSTQATVQSRKPSKLVTPSHGLKKVHTCSMMAQICMQCLGTPKTGRAHCCHYTLQTIFLAR